MPDFTKAFAKAYDAIRRVSLADPAAVLVLLNDEGVEIDSRTSGWIGEDLIGEESGGRVVELRVTESDDIDYSGVVFASWGGFRYERTGFPNPPTGNPREWIWRMIPVGREQ